MRQQTAGATPATFKPSRFAQAIHDRIANDTCHIAVNAVAGSGKTTTIVGALELVPQDAMTCFLAFNRSIVKELRERVPEHVHVRTLHSFGMNELRFRFGKDVKVDDAKANKVAKALAPGWDLGEDEERAYVQRVLRMVDLFRMTMPQSREEALEVLDRFDIPYFNGEIERAKEVMRAMYRDRKSFDFADMIYVPAKGDWRLRQYDYVFVDEAQDLNRAQQEMVRKMVRPNGGRLIAVGDPRQAIYGFAGADAASFDRIKTLFPNTVEMPLSVCYRCDADIIDHAREIVPHIEPREGAPSGAVRTGGVDEIAEGDFVLCRNTLPLVSLCLRFVADGRKATIKGGDIGKNLIAMVEQAGRKGIEPMFKKFAEQRAKLVEKYVPRYPYREPAEIPAIFQFDDKVGAIKALSEGMRRTEDLVAKIREIFTDETQGIVLSTMHKAKGLQADRVFIIEPQLIPSRMAQQPWEFQQERNLDYVARTRAKHELVYVNDWSAKELDEAEAAANARARNFQDHE